MQVKTKINSDFTNHSVNGYLKNMCKCAYGTFSLYCFSVNNNTKSAPDLWCTFRFLCNGCNV